MKGKARTINKQPAMRSRRLHYASYRPFPASLAMILCVSKPATY